MKKQLANSITVCRMACSVWMLFCPVYSVPFYGAYLLCGLTDMADGVAARKTDSVTAFGARLDSAADLVFAAAAFAKLLPVMELPLWIWGWAGIILAVRLANLATGFVCRKRWVAEHTPLNKVTGLLLFLLPLTVSFLELRYSAAVVCAVALAAALEEGHRIRTGKESL